ncbi:fibroblast growth factor receptor 1-A-like [Halichoeres trimaculatus]|uniref:fibroblast growth factor receptor 1-A-like n=1 Tax=Halichoeres trimaculatus TaxID=147232 RepID=UPI003D9EB730
MSFLHHVLLVLSCILLVLLVQATGTVQSLDQSRPSTEETDTDFAPRWVNPQKMERGLQSVRLGLSVTFQCQAIGNPVPTLRWFKNGKNFTMDQGREGFKVRRRLWMLKTKSVVLPDTGNYTCVVENKHGRLEHTFQLNVIEARLSSPVLEAGLPANQTVVVGSDVTFKCKVESGRPPPLVQWMKHITQNGSRYDPNGHPYFLVFQSSGTNEDGWVLNLKNVTLEDTGSYTCLAANAIGYSFRSAWLTVTTRPVLSYETTGVFHNIIRSAFDVLFG